MVAFRKQRITREKRMLCPACRGRSLSNRCAGSSVENEGSRIERGQEAAGRPPKRMTAVRLVEAVEYRKWTDQIRSDQKLRHARRRCRQECRFMGIRRWISCCAAGYGGARKQYAQVILTPGSLGSSFQTKPPKPHSMCRCRPFPPPNTNAVCPLLLGAGSKVGLQIATHSHT